MRLLLVVIVLAALVGLAGHAALVGTDGTWFRGAPQIETDIDTRAETAIAGRATHPVDIATDGRFVTLSGLADTPAELGDLEQRVDATAGLVWLTNDLRVLERAAPYAITATRSPDGMLVLAGAVPSVAVRERLVAHARPLFAQGGVRNNLQLASGAPDGDWAGTVEAGLTALAAMREGTLEGTDLDMRLSGTVAGEAAEAGVLGLVAAAPAGEWSTDLDLHLETARPYRFSAEKAADGTVTVSGNAPDRATRTGLLAPTDAMPRIDGTLDLAAGMPSAQWPGSVRRAMTALGAMETGQLDITGAAVRLTGTVGTDPERDALLAALGPGAVHEITVRNPSPEPGVTVVAHADGTFTGQGLLPRGLSAERARVLLPALWPVDLALGDKAARGNWTRALDALAVAMPRLEDGEASIGGGIVSLGGTLRRGISSDGTRAALAAAAGPDWQILTDLVERPPLSEAMLSMDAEGITVSGLLPQGFQPDDALTRLGDLASGQALVGGGEGAVPDWQQAFSGLGGVLTFFDTATGLVTQGAVQLRGQLTPGHEAAAIRARVLAALPAGWTPDLDITESTPNEGDTRVNIDSNETEVFRLGYWLPQYGFAADPLACRAQTQAARDADEITFVTGSAEIDARARALLNRLAGIAARCLNSSNFTLLIGGHTDSVGRDDANLALSRARAEAVRTALIERGVRADAVTADGYGESQPIDTNDTAEGRARNRRISFEWQ